MIIVDKHEQIYRCLDSIRNAMDCAMKTFEDNPQMVMALEKEIKRTVGSLLSLLP